MAWYCAQPCCRIHIFLVFLLSLLARQSVFVCVQLSPVFPCVHFPCVDTHTLKHECCAPCVLCFALDLSVHVLLPAMSPLPWRSLRDHLPDRDRDYLESSDCFSPREPPKREVCALRHEQPGVWLPGQPHAHHRLLRTVAQFVCVAAPSCLVVDRPTSVQSSWPVVCTSGRIDVSWSWSWYEPNYKLKLNLMKKSVAEDSATPIDDPNLDNFSQFSSGTRCADSSVSHLSCDGNVIPETNQLRETGSSNTLFSQVSCVGENVLGSRNLHLGNRCLWQREARKIILRFCDQCRWVHHASVQPWTSWHSWKASSPWKRSRIEVHFSIRLILFVISLARQMVFLKW